MNDHELVEAVKKKLTQDIAIMSQKMQIINDAKANNRAVVDPRELATLNQSINSTSDPKILALMLEAKVEGHSRTDRREIDPNDRYEPFVVTEDSLNALIRIIKEKQRDSQIFRFDLIYTNGRHATPIEIISDDGIEINLFNVDAHGNNLDDFANSIKISFNEYSYSNGDIQTGKGCGVFAIQNLNTLNNMSLEEKRSHIHGDIDNLDPRFFKITQSISNLPGKNRGMVISKDKSKTLGDYLDKFTIDVFDRKTGEAKEQNRAFDNKYFKYLSEVQKLIDNKSDQEIIEIIRKRSTPSEEMNTAPPATYLAGTSENIGKAITDIEGLSGVSEIENVIRNFSPMDRSSLINDRLIWKIDSIIDNSASSTIAQEINYIVRRFPENTRNNFLSPTIKLLSKVNSIDGVKPLIECFTEDDRRELIEPVNGLISRVNSAEGVADLIKCFRGEDRNKFLVPVNGLISRVNSAEGVTDLIKCFREEDRGEFLVPVNGLISRVNSAEGGADLIKCFREEDRNKFLVPVKQLISRVNLADGIKSLIECFREDDRGEFLPSVKMLLSKTSEARGLADILRYDNSLVQDVQEPLRKAISNGKIFPTTLRSMIVASPKSEHHHFLDNIKAYINNSVDINDKAGKLSLLAKHLPDDEQEKLYEDVSKLMSDDKLSQENQDKLKSCFKNFDFDSYKKPESIIVGPVSEAKDVAPPPPLPRPKEGGEGKNL